MSYNLMVFNKDSAPKTRAVFMNWYDEQVKWSENHDYNDPSISSTELRNWFMEMIKIFPVMNGPFASEDDDDLHVSDYSVGRDVIYVGFAWSVSEQAYETMLKLAEKHGVGFFDVNGNNGNILFPDNGKLKPIDESKNKSWWKFWKS